MTPLDPTFFLGPGHSAGGVSFLPLAVLVVGVGLVAFGVWQIYDAAPPAPEASEESPDA